MARRDRDGQTGAHIPALARQEGDLLDGAEVSAGVTRVRAPGELGGRMKEPDWDLHAAAY
jgi:hypothetical protein